MIKITLKHFIYDFCIHQIFEGVFKNFSFNSNNLNGIKVGTYFKTIIQNCDCHQIIYDNLKKIKQRKHYECHVIGVFEGGFKFVSKCHFCIDENGEDVGYFQEKNEKWLYYYYLQDLSGIEA